MTRRSLLAMPLLGRAALAETGLNFPAKAKRVIYLFQYVYIERR